MEDWKVANNLVDRRHVWQQMPMQVPTAPPKGIANVQPTTNRELGSMMTILSRLIEYRAKVFGHTRQDLGH